MSTEKTNAVIAAIDNDINERERLANLAMGVLEKFNTTIEEYERACRQMEVNHFVSGYLRHVKSIAETGSLKDTENNIRFHAHMQREKGNLITSSTVSIGQVTVAEILESYLNKFFAA